MLGFMFLSGCAEIQEKQVIVPLSRTLSDGDTAGFKKADMPRDFHFPEDHRPHDGFKTEWWYVTSNLDDASGNRFGIQFTLFRVALRPDKISAGDSWQTAHFWMGHLALTDASGKKFYHDERFSREAKGLAGFQEGDTAEVFLGNWKLRWAGDTFLLDAQADDFGMQFSLKPVRNPVLQGDNGLSQKGSGAGNASYYYSITRMETTGSVFRDGKKSEVSGLAWLDREWSTSMLEDGAQGWDWFSLQLSDGSDLMYYQVRDAQGQPTVFSRGIVVNPDGSAVSFRSEDVVLQNTRYWTSPAGGRYPVEHTMDIKPLGLSLNISPVLDAQELHAAVRYWEGAVNVKGRKARKDVTGRGYLEMTGYAVADLKQY
jgi:predicted secreted hydrolase